MSVGKARALNGAQEGRGTWTRRPSDGMGAPCPAWCCSHLWVLSFGFAHMCVCVFLCPHGACGDNGDNGDREVKGRC